MPTVRVFLVLEHLSSGRQTRPFIRQNEKSPDRKSRPNCAIPYRIKSKIWTNSEEARKNHPTEESRPNCAIPYRIKSKIWTNSEEMWRTLTHRTICRLFTTLLRIPWFAKAESMARGKSFIQSGDAGRLHV